MKLPFKLGSINIMKDNSISLSIEIYTRRYYHWLDIYIFSCVYLKRNLKTNERICKMLWGKDKDE